MEERKSLGGALVEVFDAGVTLVKAELSAVARKAGQVAKAKGIGAVLLLASTGPLIMGLIFIILAVFYGLMRLGLGAWAAALLIALLSFAVTGALVMMGLKKLSAEVPSDEPRFRREPMDDTDHSEPRGEHSGPRPTGPQGSGLHTARPTGDARMGVPASRDNAERDAYNPNGPRVELRRDPTEYAAGETRVMGEQGGVATVRVEHGTVTVPVYESKPGGEPQHYSSGLNKQIDGSEVGKPGHGHGHHHDPNLKEPVVLKDAPGIPVSTEPTFRGDMKRGGR
ncbi:phage holin family protein [Deinococcus aquaedulcis]|uniref:phage holin family protein n=1 Tax=Deinococcus aquaedulcis TaxID=2840455 RepID=UPI001C8408FF|nr:phage holin family protein [Deinococcus aquaedulcis]